MVMGERDQRWVPFHAASLAAPLAPETCGKGWRRRVAPRFEYGRRTPGFSKHGGVPVAAHGRDALAILTWGVGEVDVAADAVGGRFMSGADHSALLVLSVAHQEPLVYPARYEVE